ncbi:MAG TPA: hypothetical protein VNT51_11195 [Miltoncostaeaceae bacterium]|nr:hypothetical protein [Miltoncostaeaceae bacterium]
MRVLAKVEAGAVGPEEYAVGISVLPEAQLMPLLDEADLFTGLSFTGAHWLAAVVASAAERVDDAESLLFDLRVPIDLAWRDHDLVAEVIEPDGIQSEPLLPWRPEGTDVPAGTQYGIAVYTLDCGHQAVELLRQDIDAAPFWVEEAGVEELAAADVRGLSRLLRNETTLEGAHRLISHYQAKMVVHPDGEEDEEGEDDDE